MANKDYNLYFCFIDGEAFIFHRDIQKYIPVDTTKLYPDLLQYVKDHIDKCNKRPGMLHIWRLLSDYFKADTFSTYYNKKTRSIEDSFENRFTKDISEFLDTKFKRGKTDEEKEMIRKYQTESYQKFAVPEWVLAASRYNHKKNKYGRRYFRN